MDDHVHIVHGDPHAVLLAFDAPDLLVQRFERLLVDSGGEGEQIAPSNPERSDDTIFLPFLSSIALTIVSISLFINIQIGVYNLTKLRKENEI